MAQVHSYCASDLLPISMTAVLLVVTACQEMGTVRNPHEDGPPPGRVVDVFYFESLAQMVATADLVVQGTVDGVSEGRAVGSEEPRLQLLETELKVEEVLKGSVEANAVLIKTEAVGAPFEVEWREVGQRVVIFLALKQDTESAGRFFRPLNGAQSTFLVRDDDLRAVVDDECGQTIAAMTLRTTSRDRSVDPIDRERRSRAAGAFGTLAPQATALA